MEEEIYSHKCLEVAWVVDEIEDHKKVKVFNMPLKSLLKRSIKVKLQKLQSIEIEFALHVKEEVEKMELTQLVQDAKEEACVLK